LHLREFPPTVNTNTKILRYTIGRHHSRPCEPERPSCTILWHRGSRERPATPERAMYTGTSPTVDADMWILRSGCYTHGKAPTFTPSQYHSSRESSAILECVLSVNFEGTACSTLMMTLPCMRAFSDGPVYDYADWRPVRHGQARSHENRISTRSQHHIIPKTYTYSLSIRRTIKAPRTSRLPPSSHPTHSTPATRTPKSSTARCSSPPSTSLLSVSLNTPASLTFLISSTLSSNMTCSYN